MILVNGNWEQIYDLQDISKIIKENYNEELANELDKLIPNHTEEYAELEKELEESEDMVRDLEKKVDCLECEIELLEERIAELEDK